MADSGIVPVAVVPVAAPRTLSTPSQSARAGTAGRAVSPTPSAVSASKTTAGPPPGATPGDRETDTAAALYAQLAHRVTLTEQTLVALQAHVTHIAAALSSVLPSSLASPAAPAPAPVPVPVTTVPALSTLPARVFSPFDSHVSARPHDGDAGITALTQQIAALSTSVAQLQRLQTQNIALPPLGVVPPHPPQAAVNSKTQGMGLGLGNQHQRHMALPHEQFGGPGPLSPGGLISPSREGFNNSGGGPGSARGNRSFQSSLMSDGNDSTWGVAGGKFGGSGLGTSKGGREWSTSPNNSTLLPSVGSASAAGAGIVVTKWEHLNLKMELLRSISKYGIGPPNKIQARVLPFMLKGSDIIAQAPPTQERIISYVIPALQLCLSLPVPQGPYRGPAVIIITTTVDQATQCHKLVLNVGGPLGVRSALAAGASGSSALPSELQQMQRDAVQIVIGTPAKLNEMMTARGGLPGGECRLLILDEVDQLIARNLYDNVLSVARVLPSPRRAGIFTPGPFSPAVSSPYDQGNHSPFDPQSKTPFPQPSRFSTPGPASPTALPIERQTCIFSNTIPTDVVNFSQQLQVRDPVRVLVRREGSTNSQESVSSVTPGINVKHTYVYLTITGSARSDDKVADGPGTIGSGRAAVGKMSEEAVHAKEYKLETLVKMLEDYPHWQAVVHVGSYPTLEAVVRRLQQRKFETLYLAPDARPEQKKAILQQWRMSAVGQGPRFLVCFDVNPKPPDIPWSPLVVNFDLPRSVECYALRAAAAVPPRQHGSTHGVIVSFVQAAGGDVEMLRSTECAYRFKSAEIPAVFHDLFQ